MAPSQSAIRTFEEFRTVHGVLLAASGLPSQLHEQLFHKLSSETFDAGSHFAVEACEGGRQRRLILSAERMAKGSSVFLIDHAWSFRLSDALKQLKEVPGLAERMAALMCVDSDGGANEEEVGESENSRGKGSNTASIIEIVEREIEKVRARGSNTEVWLELEGLGMDDEILRSLELSQRFPVRFPPVTARLFHAKTRVR